MNHNRWLFGMILAVCALSTGALAQFGPPEPQGSGPKLNPPTAFPAPGVFPTTESVTLLNDDPQATIHYTLDGSAPNSKSAVYDPLQVLFIGGIYEGDKGLKSGYTIRVVAMRDGRTNSNLADFEYTVDRRDRTAYVSEEILPGVRMVRDSDNDKMFLVKGSRKYALIDCGLGSRAREEFDRIGQHERAKDCENAIALAQEIALVLSGDQPPGI